MLVSSGVVMVLLVVFSDDGCSFGKFEPVFLFSNLGSAIRTNDVLFSDYSATFLR